VPLETGNSLLRVKVCLDDHGPFTFVVDSGAEGTALASSVSGQLHLPIGGVSEKFSGLSGSAKLAPREVKQWSMGGLPLARQVIYAGSLAGLGGNDQPAGLLGSDVLSRFGVIRFDFADKLLIVPAGELPVPKTAQSFVGPAGVPPSSAMTAGGVTTLPVAVETAPGFATVVVRVSFGLRRGYFLVDTGSSQSSVTAVFASRASLRSAGKASVTTASSTASLSLVESGRWSIDGTALIPQKLVESGSLNGIDGILGADQLGHFRFVTIDYVNGELVLGAKRPR
jgi:hypothetical protein